MLWGHAQRYLLAALVVLVGLMAVIVTPAYAANPSELRSDCLASGRLSEDIAAIAAKTERWICGAGHFPIGAERVLLRFDIPAGDALPKYFLSRRSAFRGLHLLAIDRNGAVRQSFISGPDLPSSLAGGYFKAALPEITRDTRWVIAGIDLPSHQMTLERAFLAPRDAGATADNFRSLLLLAALAGTLVMPLIFNAAFYRVLRERFVIWHSMLTLSLLMTIVVSSGLAVILFDPPAMMLSRLTTLLFGMTVASGAMFTYHFIEPELMHRGLRRSLPWCALWAGLLSACHAAFPFIARPVQSSAYTAAFAPILAIFLISMIDAVRRGSRAARYQAIGYAPMVVVGFVRLTSGLVPGMLSADAMMLFYIGCIAEVSFTTLGMADRFLTMRRERDRARTDADVLERLSETDPLTGLLNRRAIERQFEDLRAEGFSSLAVIDLDHFKSINDMHGHAVGDAVLEAAASALQNDRDVRAYRIGGEEFMLLLRGEDAAIHGERRRRAISVCIANRLPKLNQVVTASMGMTHLIKQDCFANSYERADQLLYEAKRMGRNCTRGPVTADHLSKRSSAA
ncbi:MAG: diguanylate cyclase [Novosphingobium pentaromativorans]|uniref:diguanylate cyclase n=1 Tax=Novosphingobium pentaromativorans TaxID=205844 RepID=A0A2W5P1N9_9SPHN|nr:MAG: diguanylate cyclase [Novosphingobium pentaromativorans]